MTASFQEPVYSSPMVVFIFHSALYNIFCGNSTVTEPKNKSSTSESGQGQKWGAGGKGSGRMHVLNLIIKTTAKLSTVAFSLRNIPEVLTLTCFGL
jgi:hypothetical protein